MRKWIDLVMRVQPRHDLVETLTELALQDCSPLPSPEDTQGCLTEQVQRRHGGRGWRKEERGPGEDFHCEEKKAPAARMRGQPSQAAEAPQAGEERAGVAGGRAQQAGSQQIREALRQRPVERLGPCAGVLAEVGSDKPPTPKMRTLVLSRRQRGSENEG